MRILNSFQSLILIVVGAPHWFDKWIWDISGSGIYYPDSDQMTSRKPVKPAALPEYFPGPDKRIARTLYGSDFWNYFEKLEKQTEDARSGRLNRLLHMYI